MAYPRIRPYPTHIVDDGARSRLAAYEVVLERPVGIDLEINLAPHPAFRGEVTLSTFRGSSLVVEACAGDEVYVFVEDWLRGDRRRKTNRRSARTPPGHVYAVNAHGQKNPIAARAFAVDVGPKASLLFDLAPLAPWASHVSLRSTGGHLVLSFGAANVLHASVDAARLRPPRLAAARGKR